MKTPFLAFRLLLASGCSVLFLLASARGGIGIYESYAVVNLNGGGNAYYDCGAATANPDFQGASLGAASSLILNGGEVKSWNDGGNNVTAAYLAYRVWSGTASGSFVELSLPQNGPASGNNKDWKAEGAGVDLLSGLSAGNYTVEIYFKADSDVGFTYDSRTGANYQATFSVSAVPEPVTLALPLFGGVVLTAGLARRFISRRTRSAV